MTIIVTGGAGFIGSNFIFHMLNKYPDYRIICLDCLTYAGNLSTLEPVMSNPNFRFVKESITDREAVYKLFEEEHPDMVVNFAAESHVDRSIEDPEVFLRTNILGTAVLMDACRKYGIELDELEQKALKLLHAKTGAAIARDIYGVDDEIYSAIWWHTTGHADMTLLEKIIYLADYIEPSRDFPGVEVLRKCVYEDLDRGLLMGLEMTVQEMAEMGNPVHHATIEARDWLKGKR